MRTLLFICALITGCATNWTTSEAIEPWLPDLTFPSRVDAWRMTAEALQTLGFTVSNFAPQRIYFRKENDCSKEFAGHADIRQDTILLCPFVLDRGGQLMRWTIRHELGHLMGGGHLECKTGDVMAPSFNCWNGADYSAADFREICSGGRIDSLVCSRKGP